GHGPHLVGRGKGRALARGGARRAGGVGGGWGRSGRGGGRDPRTCGTPVSAARGGDRGGDATRRRRVRGRCLRAARSGRALVPLRVDLVGCPGYGALAPASSCRSTPARSARG